MTWTAEMRGSCLTFEGWGPGLDDGSRFWWGPAVGSQPSKASHWGKEPLGWRQVDTGNVAVYFFPGDVDTRRDLGLGSRR